MDFTLENGLICFNTKFQKRKKKVLTYIYTNNPKAQIDYIIMNKKWIKSHWIVRHVTLLKVWVFQSPNHHGKDMSEPYAGMQHKQPQWLVHA